MPGATVLGSRAGGDGHTIEYRILGPLAIRHDGLAVPTGGPKRRALLGLLLLNANRAVPVDVLLDELWGPELPRTARASLQNHVSALRRALGSDAIETTDGGYRIVVADDALDLARFERLIVEARGLEPEARAETLRAALALWRGLPLVDAPATPASQAALVRLEELRLEALEDRVEADITTGRHDHVVAELEALVVLHPFRERMWELLMTALHAGGRQADALGAYRRMHRLLTTELGIEPGDRLKTLQRRISSETRPPIARGPTTTRYCGRC
jgi:DNA-binding SARP family transcriptional activator